MIYGVFSDVHANYDALRTVLKHLHSFRPEGYLCCGDLVGYGPQPNECVELCFALPNFRCVIGNHDMSVLDRLPVAWFNSCAAEAIAFTIKTLSPKARSLLETMPLSLDFGDITLVHGSPRNPAEEYLLTGEQFLENADFWKTQVCFVGHSHVPLAMSRAGEKFPEVTALRHGEKILLEPRARYIFNPGSVGQPRDRNNRASCGIFDTEARTFEIFRLEYKVQKTQELMRRRGLSELLIERLGNGW